MRKILSLIILCFFTLSTYSSENQSRFPYSMSISDNPDSGTIYEVIQKLELDKSRTDSINHPLEYAIILNELGYLQHLYGQTNEGLNNINRAYKIFTKEEDQEGIAVSSNMIGLIYRNFNVRLYVKVWCQFFLYMFFLVVYKLM